MIGCWSHHDAWCKHWRSSPLTENNGVSRGRNGEEHSDSTRPTGMGYNPSLMNISTTLSHLMNMGFSSMSLLRIRLVKGGSEILQVTSSFPWPARGSYPPPYPLWPWQTRDIAGASCLIRHWRVSLTTQSLHAHEQELWFPECSPIEPAGWSKYSQQSPTKTQKTNWICQNLQEAKN